MKRIITILLLFALKATAQDTTITVITYPCDSLVTTTLPEQIIHVRDTTILVSDTSYNIFFDTKQYATVDGSVSTTVPIYDTIAAHDTTFTCHRCATCSRSDTVIHTDTTKTLYGVFIFNQPPTPFATRLNRAKNIAPNLQAFRYNVDRGEAAYKVKEIQDSGLLAALVFNWKPVGDVAYFPTGSDLTAMGVTLDSLLTIRKPDLLSIENEEGNPGYHKGTPYDYLAELNAMTVISHAHHVPISNGGTTQGVVYALRKWYVDRGETDSVTWLNTVLNLPVNPTPYGTQQENWYIPLLAGIATSNIDYINVHWQEPPRTDTFPTTTSKVLPRIINYVRVITGKPVITNEAGCRNHSTALLKEMFYEITNGGCKWAIYFDGNGDLSIQNEEGYKEFLNELPLKDETIKELPQVFDSLLKAKTKVSVKEILNGKK
jgi:hypothetical protein